MIAAAPPIPLADQQHIVLHDVSWQLYERLLDEAGNQPIRMTFDSGRLEIMSPLPKHEKWKKRIGGMIELIALEMNIPLEPLGSTTFRREDLAKGLEPDECYYIQHAPAIRGKDELDLRTDPPPDLAVEVDITRRSIPRQPIHAALGVPELWRFDGSRLSVLLLQPSGTYEPAAASLAFSFLPLAPLADFLRRFGAEDQTTLLRAFRDWIRVLPRPQ